jgi:hypothetical protein
MEKDIPSRPLWYLNRHPDLSSLSQLGSFRNKSKSTKIHISARNDGDKALVFALQVVSQDMGFQSC